MKKLHIITPVKDSMDTAREAIRRVMASQMDIPFEYVVYNDNSTPESTSELNALADELGFALVNLSDLTEHPSPNYLLVLQTAQQKALAEEAGLLIVESDVMVEPDTFDRMLKVEDADAGLLGAVTVDREGEVIFPYQYAVKYAKDKALNTRKRISFCCTLLTPCLLNAFDFHELNPEKDWFDVFISHKTLELGLHNWLLMDVPVLHLPHSSRPWKQLKYTHPLKYYWRKFTRRQDKI